MFISVCLFNIFHINAFSQESLYENYTVKDGLPSAQVYKIIQDDYGYLWFLTDRGISRYDGYSFENFTIIDGLTDNVFFDAKKSADSSIWLLAMNGTISIISGATPLFSAYEFNDTLMKYSIGNMPKKLFLGDETIYISFIYRNEYLEISKNGEILNLPSKINLEKKYFQVLLDNQFFYRSLNKPKDSNNLFFKNPVRAQYSDLGFMSPNRNTSVFIRDWDTLTIGSHREMQLKIYVEDPLTMGFLNDDLFWVSSHRGGIKCFSLDGELKNGLLENFVITDLYVDEAGTSWYSTLNNGVIQEMKPVVKKFNFKDESNNGVNQLTSDENGQLFIGHLDGNISVIKDYKCTKRFVSKKKHPASIANIDNQIIFNSNLHVFTIDGESVVKRIWTGYVRKFCPYEKNKIIMCQSSQYAFLTNFKEIDTVYTGTRMNSALTYQNNLWLINDYGIFKDKKKLNELSKSRSEYYQNRINDIIEFNDYLILGTNGDGLIAINNDSIIRKTRTGNLAGDFVKSIYKENDSIVWACTNSGVTRLNFNKDLSQFKSQSINHKHGLIFPAVNSICIIGDTIWMGTDNGLFYMNKAYFNKEYKQVNYNLRIKEILVNDDPIDFGAPLDLSYHENRLAIKFSIISFKFANEIKYRYKLGTANEPWVYTKNRSVVYTNLVPGEYLFTVQVKGDNSSWEEQSAQIEILISPPFWKQWWFIIITVSSIILLIYFFFKLRILVYNRDLTREILRHLLKKVKRNNPNIIVREGKKNVKIFSREIIYVKADGNYIEIHHDKGKTIVREKIGEFLKMIPDPIEYIQIRRSYIVRLDRIEQKSKKEVVVNGQKIAIGSTFEKDLEKITL